jgi:pimeloyl-ACP methyl ester carboxylesterase
MDFAGKIYKVGEIDVHVYDNGVASDDLIIIFPPGIDDGRFVNILGLEDVFNEKRVIAITYPSRRKSARLEGFDSIYNINLIMREVLVQIFSEKSYTKIYLAGFSFGSMVLTRLLQQGWNIMPDDVEIKLILVNAGEFIGGLKKKIIKVALTPTLKNKRYARFWKYSALGLFKNFDPLDFPDDRLQDIGEQMIDILDYRIDTEKQIQYKTYILLGSKDGIIDKLSLDKLDRVYTDDEYVIYDGGHIQSYGDSKEYKLIEADLARLFTC